MPASIRLVGCSGLRLGRRGSSGLGPGQPQTSISRQQRAPACSQLVGGTQTCSFGAGSWPPYRLPLSSFPAPPPGPAPRPTTRTRLFRTPRRCPALRLCPGCPHCRRAGAAGRSGCLGPALPIDGPVPGLPTLPERSGCSRCPGLPTLPDAAGRPGSARSGTPGRAWRAGASDRRPGSRPADLARRSGARCARPADPARRSGAGRSGPADLARRSGAGRSGPAHFARRSGRARRPGRPGAAGLTRRPLGLLPTNQPVPAPATATPGPERVCFTLPTG